MFETIYIGTSGLLSHAKGLRIVGNNLANVNTPGFKSSQAQFASMFEKGGAGAQQRSPDTPGALGTGVTTVASSISFRAGVDQATGNPLDLNIDGNGFYTIKRDDQILYTRSGDFRFDDEGMLVNSAGDHVLALDAGGQLVEVKLDGLGRSMPTATTSVKFTGNLSSTIATPPVDVTVAGVNVFDAAGTSHMVSLSIKNNGAGDYTVTVSAADGTVMGSGNVLFANGFPIEGASSVSFTYAAAGTQAFPVTLDFSKDVTSLATASTLSVGTRDGYAAGVRTDQTIDADGTLSVHFSNGQEVKGPRLAMANFDNDRALVEAGRSAFALVKGSLVEYGYAATGSFGALVAGHREGSNVDLAEEFGNLILMQRGYQASSHVISTANEMIQQLFDMKGNR